MDVIDSIEVKVNGLIFEMGKSHKEGLVMRFRWQDNETPWTVTIEDACLYTSMAPKRVKPDQVRKALKKAREGKAKS